MNDDQTSRKNIATVISPGDLNIREEPQMESSTGETHGGQHYVYINNVLEVCGTSKYIKINKE